MVRAAAKNHPSVAVVTDPARYDDVAAAVLRGGFTLAERRSLAADAFAHTAAYDVAVASWFASAYAPDDVATGSGFPAIVAATWDRSAVLRYGENPHQAAALYTVPTCRRAPGLAQANQLHGKEMSYNNYVDADAAWRAAHDHTEVARRGDQAREPVRHRGGRRRRRRARQGPRVRPGVGVRRGDRGQPPGHGCDGGQVAEVFTEVVLAPEFEPEALEILTRKKNIRLLRVPGPANAAPVELRPISGGLLVQRADRIDAAGDDPSTWTLAAGEPADEATLADLAFAWRAVRATKSNAILLASDGASVGVGMGQVNRVDACRLAVDGAGWGGAGPRRGRGLGRVLPVPRRSADPHRRRGPGDRRSPAARCVTRRRSPPPRPRA